MENSGQSSANVINRQVQQSIMSAKKKNTETVRIRFKMFILKDGMVPT